MTWVRRVRTWGLVLVGFFLIVRFTLPDGEDGTAYAFLRTDGVGRPVAYPCAPLRYTITTAHAPADFEKVVHGAVGLVSAASGYTFIYDGPTTNRDFTGVRPGDPILIGFAGSAEVPRLAGDTAGIGGSAISADGTHYTHGRIALDAGVYKDEDDLEARRAIVVHELGHVLGLHHVDDKDELMYKEYRGQDELGPGDIAGLKALHAQSCRKAD